jgi:hypothetical protein
MFRSLTRSAGIALAITALGASTAAATPADLRTPDAVAAGQATVVQSTPTDVRSPDARDAAVTATTTTAGTDLRTPDARDHGEGRGTFSAPDVTVVKITEPPVATGFDWGDAGIGAGGLLGIVLIALGGMLAITHHRHGRTPLAG